MNEAAIRLGEQQSRQLVGQALQGGQISAKEAKALLRKQGLSAEAAAKEIEAAVQEAKALQAAAPLSRSTEVLAQEAPEKRPL